MKQFFSADATLLDLRVWPRRLTDAEYVERTRLQMRLYVWQRILGGVLGLLAVYVLVLAIQFFGGFLLQWGGGQAGPWAACMLGLVLGFGVGWMMMGMVHAFVMMIVESRRDRLLVECWDLLQQLIAERDAALDGRVTSVKVEEMGEAE